MESSDKTWSTGVWDGKPLQYSCCILSPCLFNLYAEYIMQNARLDEAQVGIKIVRRNISNLKYACDTTQGRKWRGTKEPLVKMERGERKAGLKLNIQKTKIMANLFHHSMANRWRNNGNSDRLYFLGSKITADGDCSHQIKRCWLLGRKVMTNLDSILKSRDIILPTKVCLVKAIFFPVVMYGC